MAKRTSKADLAEHPIPRILARLKEDNDLLDAVDTAVADRGEDYFKRGAVRALRLGNRRITAHVDGTNRYEVTIDLEEEELTAACTCPYDYDGPCKHIIAVIRACEEMGTEPTEFFREEIKALGKSDLRKLVFSLAKDENIRTNIRAILQKRDENTRSPAGLARRASHILKGLRRQRLDYPLMSSGYAYEELCGILDEVMMSAAPGGEQKLLRQLEAITAPVVATIPEVPDAADTLSEFLWPMVEALTRTLLNAKLTAKQRSEWADRIAEWQAALEPKRRDDDLAPAAWAAIIGWSDEHLGKILSGNVTTRMRWESNEHSRLVLIGVLLDLLIEQGRNEEALRLARVEGTAREQFRASRAAGRIEEAVALMRENRGSSRETLEFCMWLISNKHESEAIELASASLLFEDPNSLELARWLRGKARDFGDRPLSLEAAKRAVLLSRSFEDYRWLETAAGEEWPAIRPGILAKLRERRYFDAGKTIDILLHEKMVREAFELASYLHDYGNMQCAVAAAIAVDPEFAYSKALDQANEIMDKSKSQIYHHANTWLSLARRAFGAAGKTDEWEMLLASLLQRHRHKSAMVPYLNRLKEQWPIGEHP